MKCEVCGEKAVGYVHEWPSNLHSAIKTHYFCSEHESEVYDKYKTILSTFQVRKVGFENLPSDFKARSLSRRRLKIF